MFPNTLLRTILRQWKNVFTSNSKSNTKSTADFTPNSSTDEICKEYVGALSIHGHNYVRLDKGAQMRLDIFDEFATIKEHNGTYYLGLISDLTGVDAYPILEKEYFWVQEKTFLVPGVYEIYGPIISEEDQYFKLAPYSLFLN